MARLAVDIKYVQTFTHPRSGIVYAYYRRDGRRIPIKADVNSPEFVLEVQRIESTWPKKEKAVPGSLGHAIELYKDPKNPGWADLRDKTKKSYELAFDVMKEARDFPLRLLTRPAIIKLRDEAWLPARKRWMANYCVTVLGLVLGHARDRGLIAKNPLKERVRRIRRKRGETPRNRPWTAQERRAVFEHAPKHIRLALALAMCAGLRKTDVLTASLNAIEGDVVSVRTSKRDTPVSVPIHPLLAAALKERPKSNATTIAVTSRGRPWTESGFNASWRKFRSGLEKKKLVGKGLTPHGLRHTLGTMLKEVGLPDGDIADVLGQAGTSMARHYSKEAALPAATQAAIAGLDFIGAGKTTSGTRVSTSPEKTVNQSQREVCK